MVGPIIVPAPKVGFHFKDAVVVEAEHNEDAPAFGLGQDAIELPRVIHAVMDLVSALALDREGLMPHPDPQVIDARLAVGLEPIIVIAGAPPAMPTGAQPVQEKRRAVVQTEIPFLPRLDAGQPRPLPYRDLEGGFSFPCRLAVERRGDPQPVRSRFEREPTNAPYPIPSRRQVLATVLQLALELTAEKAGHAEDFSGRRRNFEIQRDHLGIKRVGRGRHPRDRNLDPFEHLGLRGGQRQLELARGIGPASGHQQQTWNDDTDEAEANKAWGGLHTLSLR